MLEKKGFANNTLVLFSSDNGGVNKPENVSLVQTTAQNAGLKPVGPFRGGKHDVWEGGFRVPYLVRWPGHVPAATVCDETISIVDTLASIASITGCTLPPAAKAAEDSHDVSMAWLGKVYQKPLRPDIIVHSADGNFAIRKGKHKWIEGVPADDVRPASKKARAIQFKRQLYDLEADVAETRDISAEQSIVVNELESLLNRYRDGGYSRQLPPLGTKAQAAVSALPIIEGMEPIDLVNYRGDAWKMRDGALYCKAGAKGAPFSGPLSLDDGVLEFKIMLGDADRHSLRIHTADNKSSFRVVLSRASLEIAKNPGKGESTEQTVPLGKTRVKFKSSEWQTLRLTFVGKDLTAQFAGTTTKANHAVIAEPKMQANFIAFEGEVGIKDVMIKRSGP